MLGNYKKDYPTYAILPGLKKITRLTASERSLNRELETFNPEAQKKILVTMRQLMEDEMVFVLSVENMTRNHSDKVN